MSNANIIILGNCNYCSEYDGCTKKICNSCGTCEGTIHSFTGCDFDLCNSCFIELASSLVNGLQTLNQPYILTEELIINEKIIVTRKRITETQRNEIFDRDGKKCVQCGSTNFLCIDHIMPFSRGGTTDNDNLQTLCKTCNSKKGNRIIENNGEL